MAEVLLLHHVLGRTKGIEAFANQLRDAGHTVHVPDLFDGRIFSSLEEGLAFVKGIGFEEVTARGVRAAWELPRDVVYAGFSLGVSAAQQLAQTRDGARGALFFHACLPTSAFESEWPADLPVQVHAMSADSFFVEDGDIEAAHELVASANHAELFLYEGKEHLFTDSSLPSYDADATKLVIKRVLDFLA
ncbi:dienelactone hydrolase family protein [Caldibacillus lycopersici]|uniref:Dienelactone hydrolase family protein n=1 Tax=Perspicuibacillus lycopersici TaxID=1325689 RepID=A0AAE3LNN0_9BACI|nr:dienelactone hydrolase family protein [Perspicuibacillus lycopersici]MCU9614007.1 dienelactone hydrolase family protein [Perspicuibacillus lycopersici]